MTYCVVQINCLPLPRFLKEVTMKTAEERYEETWNSYLELLNKNPRYLCNSVFNKKNIILLNKSPFIQNKCVPLPSENT